VEWVCGSLATLLALCLVCLARERAAVAKLRWERVEWWHRLLEMRRQVLAGGVVLDVSPGTDTILDELDDWRDRASPRLFPGPPV
jgi:hypothetical protein